LQDLIDKEDDETIIDNQNWSIVNISDKLRKLDVNLPNNYPQDRRNSDGTLSRRGEGIVLHSNSIKGGHRPISMVKKNLVGSYGYKTLGSDDSNETISINRTFQNEALTEKYNINSSIGGGNIGMYEINN
jgi:hypothetical protein